MPYSSLTLDPYVELDVPRHASLNEIRQAYRRVALASHPDHHAKDPTAAERFRRASQSYALLRDPERRRRYDRTGQWDESRWEPGDLDMQLVEALELFARDFGETFDLSVMNERTLAHTGLVTMTVDVSYEDVERGVRRRLPTPCAECAGSGARDGSAHVRCTSCGGSGRLRHVETSFLGPRIHTERCDSCHGSGRRPILVCPSCNGSGQAGGAATVEVLIPRGTADGDTLASIPANGSRFVARLIEDQRWARDGSDLYAIGRMRYEVAVLGGTVSVELPGRTYHLQVAAATASGQRVRIPGQGLPLPAGKGRGDLILTLHVIVPDRVGRLDRWLLKTRARRSGETPARADGAGGIARLHAWARGTARAQWQQWRTHQHTSSLLRIETTAASLRSAAALLSQSEQRLGPLLERAFPLIAPQAASARERLRSGVGRYAALSHVLVSCVPVIGLVAGLWLLAHFAAPAIAAIDTDPWWNLLRQIHPAFFAIVPLAAGMATGGLRAAGATVARQRLAAIPLGAAVGAAAAATGAAVYALITRLDPGADALVITAISVVLAATVGMAPVFLFLLGDSIFDSARAAFQELGSRADQRTLRAYDAAAARLATHLERTERAFRQLLTQADDARHPLTSLLHNAAESLAGDHPRRIRSVGSHAGISLAAGVAITAVWLAATVLAVAIAVTLPANAAVWVRVAVVPVIAALCSIGVFLAPAVSRRRRIRRIVTSGATLLAIAALLGLLYPGAGAEWIGASAATAALVLSFRLPESVRATATAAAIATAGGLALLLWPLAAASALVRGD